MATQSLGIGRINSHLPADPREVIPALATARGESLAELSRMLSRGDSYLGRFVREGIPVALNARDHRLLADHFGVSERGLGIRTLWGWNDTRFYPANADLPQSRRARYPRANAESSSQPVNALGDRARLGLRPRPV